MDYREFPLKTNRERNYILLSDIIDFFEPQIFGGTTKANQALQLARVQYGNQPAIEDDIPSGHHFFRRRGSGLVTKFLDDNNLQSGDMVRLERVEAFSYRFTPV